MRCLCYLWALGQLSDGRDERHTFLLISLEHLQNGTSAHGRVRDKCFDRSAGLDAKPDFADQIQRPLRHQSLYSPQPAHARLTDLTTRSSGTCHSAARLSAGVLKLLCQRGANQYNYNCGLTSRGKDHTILSKPIPEQHPTIMASSEALAPAAAYDVEPAGGNRHVIPRPSFHCSCLSVIDQS